MNKPNLYTIREVAEKLGVSPDTVVKRCKEGVLSRININPKGKRPQWRLPRELVDKLIS